MEDPPAAVVLLAEVVLVEGPIVETGLPKTHADENFGHSLVGESFKPVWGRKSYHDTYEGTDCKQKAKVGDEAFGPLQRHVESLPDI